MSEEQLFDFTEQINGFVRVLRTRRWTIATFFVVTSIVVAIGTSLQTPLYEATASILVDMELPSVLAVSTQRDDSTVGTTNYMTYADYYRTQLEVIVSRKVANRVFENLNLGEQEKYRSKKDPVGELIRQVRVEPVKQTRIMKIHVEDASPVQAAQIANEFSIVFVQNNLEKGAMTESLTLMKNEYLKLQSKEAELSRRYKEKFPARVRVRQQMDQLVATIEKELDKQMSMDTNRDVAVLPEGGRPMAENEKASSSLFQRLRESSLVGGVRPNNIRIQDFARVPVKRSKPNVLLNLLLGVFLGIFGGIGAAIAEEFLDNTVKTNSDIEHGEGLTLLGVVPHIKAQNGGIFDPHADGFHKVKPEVEKAQFQVTESYRAIRTNFIYTIPQSEMRASIVTSPGAGEGKSLTSSNLAVALSQVNCRVLLVDADLRKPTVHKLFDVEKGPGLTDYLIGRASFEEVVQIGSNPALAVVTSGHCPPNPAELLSSPKMLEFIQKATSKFDQVFFDTPPVIPVTDATILASILKSVIVVAHSGKTPRQGLRRVVSVCEGVGAKVLGVILNNVTDLRIPHYGYDESVYQYGSSFEENGGEDNTGEV